MRKNYVRWISSIVLSLTLISFAQADARNPSRSFNEIVELVTNQNPEIRYYEAEISKATGTVFNSQKLPNPEFSVELGRKDSSVSGLNEGQGLAWEISYAQTFEYPGRIELREAIAKKQVALAELQLKKFKLALTNKARNIALDLYQAQQNREIAQSIAKKVQALTDTLSKRESAGPALTLERKLIEGSAISFRQRAVQFSGEAEKLSIELNTLGSIDPSTRYQVKVSQFGRPPIVPSVSSLEVLALDNNPEILARRAALSQQELKIKLAENEQNPSFTVRPFYSEEDSGDLERTVGIGFSVPLPIYNDNSGNIAIEKSEAIQGEAALKSIEQEVRGRIASLHASYKLQSQQSAMLGTESINNLRSAAQEAEKQYELGVIPAATYLQLQEQYLSNLILYRGSQIQMLKDVAELEQTVGTTFFRE